MKAIAQSVVYGILMGGVYAVMASGLSLIFGVTKVTQIAHTALIIVGCYLSFWLAGSLGVDPFLSILITAPALFALGVLIYKLVVAHLSKGPPIAILLALFGVVLIVENLVGILWSTDYRAIYSIYQGRAISLGNFTASLPRLMAFGVAVVAMGLLFCFLRYTEIGRAIRATSQDRETAQVLGVDIEKVFLIVFGISTALAGVGGSLMGIIYSFYPALHWQWLGVVFSVVVLGGLGSIQGAVLAAVIIGIAESLTSSFIGIQWSPAVAFTVLLTTLMVRPQGLLGAREERI